MDTYKYVQWHTSKATDFNKQKPSVDKETKDNSICMWAPERNPYPQESDFLLSERVQIIQATLKSSK